MKCLRVLAVAAMLGLVGCAQEEAGTKTETTVTTPEGETTVTEEKKVETSGDHAPTTPDTTTTPAPATNP